MLSREQNELLTRVGPGTPMGEVLREYWVPAARSAALVPDGAPQRVRIFGENFVVFRSTDKRIGFFDEACPHRGASLALARNADNALQCIFHGWKVDVSGKVVDTPCELPKIREAFANSAKVHHYPTQEGGGIVWVYLGKEKTPPRFPHFEFMDLPEANVHVRRAVLPYNWLQGLEGHLDSAHLGVLHAGLQADSGAPTVGAPSLKQINDDSIKRASANSSPKIEMDYTPYGIQEGALRETADGVYARIRQVVLPFFVFIPFGPNAPCSWRATVPIDDYHDAEWYMLYDTKGPVSEEFIEFQWVDAAPDRNNFAANLGSVENMWGQDREAMKTHWSGLMRNIPFEDFTVTSSMGPILDRTREQLGPSDVILVHVRRMLLEAIEATRAGKPAPWQTDTIDYTAIRALAVNIAKSDDWRKSVAPVATVPEF